MFCLLCARCPDQVSTFIGSAQNTMDCVVGSNITAHKNIVKGFLFEIPQIKKTEKARH